MPRSVLLLSAAAIVLAAAGVSSGLSGAGAAGPAITGAVLELLLIAAVVPVVSARRVLFATGAGVAAIAASVATAALTATVDAADGGPATGLLGALGLPAFLLAATAASVAVGAALRSWLVRISRRPPVRVGLAALAGAVAAAWLSFPFAAVAVALALFVAALLRSPRRTGPPAQSARRAALSTLLLLGVVLLAGAAGVVSGGQAGFIAVWAAPLAAVPLAGALPIRPLARTATQVGAVAATAIAVTSLLHGPEGDGWLLGCLAAGAGIGAGAALTWVPDGAGRAERAVIALAACLTASLAWMASLTLAGPLVAAVSVGVLVATRRSRRARAAT